jgi:hypothetical protein
VRAIDALQYAPGATVCRVELRDHIIIETDKAVATVRKVLWVADGTRTLHEFSIWAARQALLAERKAGREPDPRSFEVLRVKARWLKGLASDRELSAAESAAWSAAENAAENAAWGAAWSAALRAARSVAKSAAESAAEGAAWSAALSAAESAAEGAAWSAARSAQDKKLTALLLGLDPRGNQ